MGEAQKKVTVGLVGPANWLADDLLAQAIMRLENANFGVKQAANLGLKLHDMPGTPQARAAGLMAVATDPDVDVLWAVGGGYGCTQMVEWLDWTGLKKVAKPLVGYSDITYLLNAWMKHGIALGWHAPMPRDLAENFERADIPSVLATLATAGVPTVNAGALAGAKILQAGYAAGVLWGGSLSVLASMVGADDCPHRGQDSILFIEEIGERIHKLDKWLWQLRHAGWLNNVQGVLVGRMTEIDDYAPKPFGLTVEEVVQAQFRDIPVLTQVECGHAGLNFPLPFGAMMRLQATETGVTLKAIEGEF